MLWIWLGTFAAFCSLFCLENCLIAYVVCIRPSLVNAINTDDCCFEGAKSGLHDLVYHVITCSSNILLLCIPNSCTAFSSVSLSQTVVLVLLSLPLLLNTISIYVLALSLDMATVHSFASLYVPLSDGISLAISGFIWRVIIEVVDMDNKPVRDQYCWELGYFVYALCFLALVFYEK